MRNLFKINALVVLLLTVSACGPVVSHVGKITQQNQGDGGGGGGNGDVDSLSTSEKDYVQQSPRVTSSSDAEMVVTGFAIAKVSKSAGTPVLVQLANAQVQNQSLFLTQK